MGARSRVTVRRLFPPAFGALLLAMLVGAAFVPAGGALPAQTGCPYGNCTSPSSNAGFPLWGYFAIAGILFLAALFALLFLIRRRQGGGRGGAPPPREWTGPESGAGAPPGAVAPPAPYIEGPEDVGVAPAVLPPRVAAGPKPPVAGEVAGARAGEEPSIDSLMDELDRISGEILKKEKPKGPPPEAGQDAGESER